jgi:hypothetical protein
MRTCCENSASVPFDFPLGDAIIHGNRLHGGEMNALLSARSLLLALMAAGVLAATMPVAFSAEATPRSLTETAVKSVPHSGDSAAVKTSPADPVPRSQDDSRAQLKMGRLLEASLLGRLLLRPRTGPGHDAHRFCDPSPITLQVRLQI